MHMVSMKDIAKKCGVSVATVSKALNDHKDIGAETRRRICAVAEEMGYMANSVARALKTNRSYNLGMLLVDERRSGLGHEYFSTIIEGFKAEAESHGYDITFINSHVGDQPTSYVKHCRYRGLDGVLVACATSRIPGFGNWRLPTSLRSPLTTALTAILQSFPITRAVWMRWCAMPTKRAIEKLPFSTVKIPLSPGADWPVSIRPVRNWD